MKKYLYIAASFALASCSSDDLKLENEFFEGESGIVAQVPAFEMEKEDGGSRSTLTPGSSGMTFAWENDDKLAVYGPSGSTFTNFVMSSATPGAGAEAVFHNDDFRLAPGSTYYCVYPCIYDESNQSYTVTPATAFPIDVTGQTQTTNNSTAHLGAVDYVVAKGVAADGTRCRFSFSHLCAILKLTTTVGDACTISKVTLTSGDATRKFTTKGTVDLTSDNPTVTPTETSQSFELPLGTSGAGIQLTAGQMLTVYLAVPAVSFLGTTLEVKYTCTDGGHITTVFDGKNFVAGKAYAYNSDNAGWVDLGLPSGRLWATCNLGSNKPEGHGNYYVWADLIGYTPNPDFYHRNFVWTDCTYNDGTTPTETTGGFTKYTLTADFAHNGAYDGKALLELSDDAAYNNRGHNWRMPTKEDFDELVNAANTSREYMAINGAAGIKFTSLHNGNTIFFPIRGYLESSSLRFNNHYYWSSSLYSNGLLHWQGNAYGLDISDNVADTKPMPHNRCQGAPIRPVRR